MAMMAGSLLARILAECSTIHSPPAHFFLKVQINSRTVIPLFKPGSVQSGSTCSDDCGRVFSDELRVSSLPDRFPHCAWTAAWSTHSDFVGSRVYACLHVTCNPHFWPNGRGLLRGTAVTRGVERTPSKSQHTK